MSNGNPTYSENVLKIQKYLFSQVNKSILTDIYDAGTKIAAFNISEADFPYLKFLTNNPTYNEDPIGLISIDVYLIKDGVLSQVPVQIDGLYEIINGTMQDGDSAAFINGSSTNQPFINGIGVGGDTIGKTVDNLARYSPYSPDTNGIPKVFTITLYGALKPNPGKGQGFDSAAASGTVVMQPFAQTGYYSPSGATADVPQSRSSRFSGTGYTSSALVSVANPSNVTESNINAWNGANSTWTYT